MAISVKEKGNNIKLNCGFFDKQVIKGLSDAKFIETAKWDADNGWFTLSKRLNKGCYLIVINDTQTSFLTIINDSGNVEASGSVFTGIDENGTSNIFNSWYHDFGEYITLNIATYDDDGYLLEEQATAKVDIYQLPFKMGETQPQPSGDNIKVADMKVSIEDGEVLFDFENCPAIDFYKGFRIEIFESGNLYKTWLFKGLYSIKDDYNDLVCTNVDDNITESVSSFVNNEDIAGYCLFYSTEDFYCQIRYFLTYLENPTNKFTAKIYYHEANETTLHYAMDL